MILRYFFNISIVEVLLSIQYTLYLYLHYIGHFLIKRFAHTIFVLPSILHNTCYFSLYCLLNKSYKNIVYSFSRVTADWIVINCVIFLLYYVFWMETYVWNIIDSSVCWNCFTFYTVKSSQLENNGPNLFYVPKYCLSLLLVNYCIHPYFG